MLCSSLLLVAIKRGNNRSSREHALNSCISREMEEAKNVLDRTNLERLTLIMNHDLKLSMKTLPKFHIKLLEFVNLAAAMTRRSSLVIVTEGKS